MKEIRKEPGALSAKAAQAQLIYDDLLTRQGIETIPTVFVADNARVGLFARSCVTANPFPAPFSAVLASKRIPGVKKLFTEEKIPQTAAIAAVLAACSSVATEIGRLRGDDVVGAKTYCDVAFAGLQAIRLYMADYSGKKFRKAREAFLLSFLFLPLKSSRDF
jgi:hypothetical protein